MVDQLSLAVNGRENQLRSKLAAFPLATQADRNGHGNGHAAAGQLSVAIVGMGYVGLPTAAANGCGPSRPDRPT
jgi:hypothetical protein